MQDRRVPVAGQLKVQLAVEKNPRGTNKQECRVVKGDLLGWGPLQTCGLLRKREGSDIANGMIAAQQQRVGQGPSQIRGKLKEAHTE